MALDRQRIERRDFPIGRRGYDTAAVDAHLSSLAEQVGELERFTRRRSDTLAAPASERVRAILEAAETSAAEINRDAETSAAELRRDAETSAAELRRDAENDAHALRDQADSELKATRARAAEEARAYIARVSESTSNMMQRLDSIESELGSLIGTLRASTDRLSADLQLLETNLGEVDGVMAPRGFGTGPGLAVGDFDDGVEATETEPARELGEPAQGAGRAIGTGGADIPRGGEEHPGESDAEAERHTEGAGDTAPAALDDAEGARLVALNMALNGTTRDETWRYLLENFQLSDASGLLDEVYASVEG